MNNYRIGTQSYDYFLDSAEASELRRELADIEGFVKCKGSDRGGYYPDNGHVVIRSYHTDVARFNPEAGTLSKLWDGWSRTSAKHIDDALHAFGFRGIQKREWIDLSLADYTGEIYELTRI